MAPQQYQPSYTEASQSQTYKRARHRRYHPYQRNVASLQRTDDDGYRAVYERPNPIMGLANIPVQGIVDFRVPGQEPAGEGRVKLVFGAILRFVAGLRQKVEGWLGLDPINAFPQPRPAVHEPANEDDDDDV